MRALLTCVTLLLAMTLALAQAPFAPPDPGVTQADRQQAAMMILVFVVGGMLAVYGLLWVLRQRGILKEEKPDPKLEYLKDEIARRSDETKKDESNQ